MPCRPDPTPVPRRTLPAGRRPAASRTPLRPVLGRWCGRRATDRPPRAPRRSSRAPTGLSHEAAKTTRQTTAVSTPAGVRGCCRTCPSPPAPHACRFGTSLRKYTEPPIRIFAVHRVWPAPGRERRPRRPHPRKRNTSLASVQASVHWGQEVALAQFTDVSDSPRSAIVLIHLRWPSDVSLQHPEQRLAVPTASPGFEHCTLLNPAALHASPARSWRTA